MFILGVLAGVVFAMLADLWHVRVTFKTSGAPGYGLWNTEKNRWMRPIDVCNEEAALTCRTRADAEIGKAYHELKWGIKSEVRPFDWAKETTNG